jgi:hypothetical protein
LQHQPPISPDAFDRDEFAIGNPPPVVSLSVRLELEAVASATFIRAKSVHISSAIASKSLRRSWKIS